MDRPCGHLSDNVAAKLPQQAPSKASNVGRPNVAK